MIGRARALVHRVVAQPAVYETVQRVVGAGKLRTRLGAVIAALGTDGVVLDLGGGTGLYRGLWPRGWAYLLLDNDANKIGGFVRAGPRDGALLGDAARVPIRTGSLDAVLCTAVSHHLPDDALDAFVGESARILRPSGTLVFLDAVWRPRRLPSRLLWAFDRGSHPRTREHLVAVLDAQFDATVADGFAILHEYVLYAGTPRDR